MEGEHEEEGIMDIDKKCERACKLWESKNIDDKIHALTLWQQVCYEETTTKGYSSGYAILAERAIEMVHELRGDE